MEIHAILTETLPCFLPVRAKDLSAPLYLQNLLRAFLLHSATDYVTNFTIMPLLLCRFISRV